METTLRGRANSFCEYNPDGPELSDEIPSLKGVKGGGEPVGEHCGNYVSNEKSWSQSFGVAGWDVTG